MRIMRRFMRRQAQFKRSRSVLQAEREESRWGAAIPNTMEIANRRHFGRLTMVQESWDIPTMIASVTDDKRRLTMPKELPPKSAVTIQQLDSDSWLVTRQHPIKDLLVVALPTIKGLPSDPEWEAIERGIVKRTNKKLPPFEE
jgi:hypothetical protein